MDRRQSPLPEAEAYWDALADRVRADAAAPLAEYAAASAARSTGGVSIGWRRSWSSVVSRQAPWLVAASAVLMVSMLFALPQQRPAGSDRQKPDAESSGLLARSLFPQPAAGLLAGDTPPSAGELFVAMAGSTAVSEEAR